MYSTCNFCLFNFRISLIDSLKQTETTKCLEGSSKTGKVNYEKDVGDLECKT